MQFAGEKFIQFADLVIVRNMLQHFYSGQGTAVIIHFLRDTIHQILFKEIFHTDIDLLDIFRCVICRTTGRYIDDNRKVGTHVLQLDRGQKFICKIPDMADTWQRIDRRDPVRTKLRQDITVLTENHIHFIVVPHTDQL